MHPQVSAALDAAQVAYTERRHADYPATIASPADFAAALGYAVERISKTLFLRASDQQAYAAVTCSVVKKLDLPALAAHFGWRRAQVASRDELLAATGYQPTGVSPLGIANCPVVLDAGLFDFPTILIGGGEVGVEIELTPAALQRAAHATVLSITLPS
ncbi:MAG: aminoacyl-tRNA deacylase [Ktedonobacterales bacterium]